MKPYFQYYETFDVIVNKFKTAEEQAFMQGVIIRYGLYGEEPEGLNEVQDMAFLMVRELIDSQVHRRETNKRNRAEREAKKEEPATAEEQQEPESTPEAEPEKPAEETKPEPQKTKRFQKPTAAEVQEYCTERNNGINGQQFVDYYEARGWKIGQNSMKDWKAAVRNWEQRRAASANKPPTDWPAGKLML